MKLPGGTRGGTVPTNRARCELGTKGTKRGVVKHNAGHAEQFPRRSAFHAVADLQRATWHPARKIGFRLTKGLNMRVADVMTRSVFIVNPDETIQEAAMAMAGIDAASCRSPTMIGS